MPELDVLDQAIALALALDPVLGGAALALAGGAGLLVRARLNRVEPEPDLPPARTHIERVQRKRSVYRLHRRRPSRRKRSRSKAQRCREH